MSYRDVKNFTEILRTLGYRRIISLENFRSPNFPLISEILLWLVRRFYPDCDIPSEYDTPEQRVLFMRSVAEFMVLKANIKLNLRKLYQADGHAVKEMLKICTWLYEALKVDTNVNDTSDVSFGVDLSTKIQELKLTRELSSQITEKGSALFDILNKEPVLRDIRQNRVNSLVDIKRADEIVNGIISATEASVTEIKRQIESLSSAESSLDVKINKKESEIERSNKRLHTLKKVRPAFLDEFEQLEKELNNMYEEYIVRFKCNAYLEHQLQQLHGQEEREVAATNADAEQEVTRAIAEEPVLYEPFADETGDNFQNSPINKNQKRIKTAVQKSSVAMYGAPITDNATGNNNSLDSITSDISVEDNDDLLDDISVISNGEDTDESKMQHSDPEAEKSHLSDNKSDDAF